MIDSDTRQVRTLHWRMFNGTQDEREYALQIYESILIDLWKQHVARTGDKYYPPLQNELMEEFQLNEDRSTFN